MSNERFQAKNFFQLNGGLNTELNELNFQDGFTIDEANYELLVDGSRRRRKGLAAESGAGTAKTIDTLGAGYANQTYLWENAGGDPDKRFMVFRTGDYLYFATADETVSDDWYSGAGSFVNLSTYRTDDGTDALCQKGSVSFSQGRGHLFVSGQYIKPFYVKYAPATDTFSTELIQVRIRDYTTIDDGTQVNNEPTGTITADHRYNLRNRGWPEDRMDAYLADQSKHPSRNSIWYKGYKRTSDTTVGAGAVNPDDGTKSWDSAKLDAEAFGSSEAPRGSLFLDVFDTTTGYGNEDPGDIFTISAQTYDHTGPPAYTHTLTVTGHGLAGPAGTTHEVVISGNSFTWNMNEGGDIVPAFGSLDGTRTVTYVDANTLTVVQLLANYEAASFSLTNGGTMDTGGSVLARSTGTDHGDSFKALAFHDGRVFYAGMLNSEFNDYIMFSQIADTAEKYSKCYQEADPTDENFNALTPADGGYMVIPGMGGVLAMASIRNSLIVLAKSGVWEVSGGQRGVFTADGYSVRKLSASGASSPYGFVALEDNLLYCGPGGIFAIGPNQYTGILEVISASDSTVQTLWNQVTDAEQQRVQMVYDNALKRVYMMWGPNGTSIGIDTMLIYDARAQAWFKYTFDTPTDNVLLTGFALANADDTSDNKKMKFIYEVTTTTVQVADFDQTGFDDWDGTNGPLPYLVFGEDNVGDHQSRRQAPVVTVYSKRTETKWTASGGGYTPDNPSSTLLTGFWDWSDAVQWTTTAKADQEPWDGTAATTTPSVSGKISKQQETYRNVRNYVPYGDATSEVTGYPVVVTRNKIRGRGRALRLRFDGATDKDSHILGYTMNYKVPRRHNV